MKGLFILISKNKIFQYIFSRYLTYLIQFINTIFIAINLGPFYLGIWGFILLVLQYIGQFDLGIAHSVNAIISINKQKNNSSQEIIGSALTLLMLLSFVVTFLFIFNQVFEINIGKKYNFDKYYIFVLIIGIIGYFNNLLSNVFRVHGHILEIAINQSIFPISCLIVIFNFKGENLILAMITANIFSFFLSFSLFIYRSPIKLKPLWDLNLFKTIQLKGFYLFIYNTSFYLIAISTKSFVSYYYSINEFGLYTFAFSLANAIILFLGSLSFLIFPKVINRLANNNDNNSNRILTKLRDSYITISHLLILISVFLFPVFILFTPQYENSTLAFGLVALTVGLYSNAFGYSSLLIAKNKEKRLSRISFYAFLINLILCYLITNILNLSFSWISIATMISYFFFISLITKEGREAIKLENTVNLVFNDAFPIRIIIPFITSFFIISLSFHFIFNLIPIFLFILINYKNLISSITQMKEIIIRPSVIDI